MVTLLAVLEDTDGHTRDKELFLRRAHSLE